MFSKAYNTASQYTQPVLISHRFFDGRIESGRRILADADAVHSVSNADAHRNPNLHPDLDTDEHSDPHADHPPDEHAHEHSYQYSNVHRDLDRLHASDRSRWRLAEVLLTDC